MVASTVDQFRWSCFNDSSKGLDMTYSCCTQQHIWQPCCVLMTAVAEQHGSTSILLCFDAIWDTTFGMVIFWPAANCLNAIHMSSLASQSPPYDAFHVSIASSSRPVCPVRYHPSHGHDDMLSQEQTAPHLKSFKEKLLSSLCSEHASLHAISQLNRIGSPQSLIYGSPAIHAALRCHVIALL